MRLKRVPKEAGDPADGYMVEEIASEDIAPPSDRFLSLLRGLSGFTFVNSLTVDEFTQQVRKRFASHEP